MKSPASATMMTSECAMRKVSSLRKLDRHCGASERWISRAPAADVVMLGRGRNDRRGGEREGDDGGGLHGSDTWLASRHHHGGRRRRAQCWQLAMARGGKAS